MTTLQGCRHGKLAMTLAGCCFVVAALGGARQAAPSTVPPVTPAAEQPKKPRKPRAKPVEERGEGSKEAPAAVPATAAPPDIALPDRTIDLKAATSRYCDGLRSVVFDASVATSLTLRLAPESAPITIERKNQLVAAKRARERLRDAVRDLRADAARVLLEFHLDSLVAAARSCASDMQLHVAADLEALDEISRLLAERGPDKYASFSKAAHTLRDLDTGDRGARRKATLKAILALKTK